MGQDQVVNILVPVSDLAAEVYRHVDLEVVEKGEGKTKLMSRHIHITNFGCSSGAIDSGKI